MKVLVFLAEGFEEVEALTVVDYLRRASIGVDTVSIGEKTVKGAHDIIVTADKLLSEVESVAMYDAVVIPGGIPGATNLRDNDRVIEIVKSLDKEDKLLAAICAGPVVLQKAGVIKGLDVTSYPGFEDELPDCNYMEASVVKDGNVITARGPALATDFAIEIISYLLEDRKIKEFKKGILYSE